MVPEMVSDSDGLASVGDIKSPYLRFADKEVGFFVE
jgi:hypothetical protein